MHSIEMFCEMSNVGMYLVRFLEMKQSYLELKLLVAAAQVIKYVDI